MKNFREPLYFILVDSMGGITQTYFFKATISMSFKKDFCLSGIGFCVYGSTLVLVSKCIYNSTDNITFINKEEFIKKVKGILTLDEFKDNERAKEQVSMVLKYETI